MKVAGLKMLCRHKSLVFFFFFCAVAKLKMPFGMGRNFFTLCLPSWQGSEGDMSRKVQEKR